LIGVCVDGAVSRMSIMVALDGDAVAPARLTDVDALRGFALLGILIANIAFFASGYPAHLAADPAHSSWLDNTIEWLVRFFVDTKFYLLFSFLFGYSFTLQLDSAARAGASFAPRFLRRLGGLFVLGVLHAILLFHGDILTTYAVLGLVLLARKGLSPRTAVLSAVLITCVVVATVLLTGNPLTTDPAVALADGARTTEAFRGGLSSVIAEHLRLIPAQLASAAGQAPLALSAFLVGLAAGRRRVLAEIDRHAVALRRIQQVGYPVGFADAAVFAFGGGTANTATLAVGLLTAPLLAAAYAASALRFFRSGRGAQVARALASPGRMALTNYLGQSLVCVLLFTGCGFALVGRLDPPLVLLVALVIFLGQIVISAWWLRRHHHGPVEWALRAATYWRSPGRTNRGGRPRPDGSADVGDASPRR
jgi:uncharacterized protein